MSETRQIHFALNMTRTRDKQISDYINTSGKKQKDFIIECIEYYMNGGSTPAQGTDNGGAGLILEKLQRIECILATRYTPPQEQPKEDIPLDGQMDITDYITPENIVDARDIEIDDEALDFLGDLGE